MKLGVLISVLKCAVLVPSLPKSCMWRRARVKLPGTPVPKISCKSYYTRSGQSFFTPKILVTFLVIVIFSWPFISSSYTLAPLPSLAQLRTSLLHIYMCRSAPSPPYKIILHTLKFLLHTLCSKTHYFRPGGTRVLAMRISAE